MLSTKIKVETEVLFSSGSARLQVYNEIFKNLQSNFYGCAPVNVGPCFYCCPASRK